MDDCNHCRSDRSVVNTSSAIRIVKIAEETAASLCRRIWQESDLKITSVPVLRIRPSGLQASGSTEGSGAGMEVVRRGMYRGRWMDMTEKGNIQAFY